LVPFPPLSSIPPPSDYLLFVVHRVSGLHSTTHKGTEKKTPSTMNFLASINENPTVQLVYHIVLTVVSFATLITSFVLATDIYGAGPAFAVITSGMSLTFYCGYLIFASKRQILNANLNFGVSLLICCMTLQQAVMWGGLAQTSFSTRMLSLAGIILNQTADTCVAACDDVDVDKMVTEVSEIDQNTDGETAMVVFQTILFIIWIPYTIAQGLNRNVDGGSTNSAETDYSIGADYTNDAAQTTTDYTDL